MYVLTKIGRIQSIYQNFDHNVIKKVKANLPIIKVHFKIYFNICLHVRIHKYRPNLEQLSEFR